MGPDATARRWAQGARGLCRADNDAARGPFDFHSEAGERPACVAPEPAHRDTTARRSSWRRALRPLAALSKEEACSLEGVVFDLDDTLLDRGQLGEPAYRALFRLREVGLRLVGCTGRPLGWAEVLVRQWPVDLFVAENGAAAVARDAEGRLERVLAVGDAAVRDGRAGLVTLAERLVREFPAAALADDNGARATDVTIDIGEHRRVPAEAVAAMRARCHAEGVRTLASSVHLHLTYAGHDKASGTVAALAARFGIDPARALARYAYVGDSGNDAAAFAAFRTTFGVANVARHLDRLTIAPRFVAPHAKGLGFAAIAAHLSSLRTGTELGASAAAPGETRV